MIPEAGERPDGEQKKPESKRLTGSDLRCKTQKNANIKHSNNFITIANYCAIYSAIILPLFTFSPAL